MTSWVWIRDFQTFNIIKIMKFVRFKVRAYVILLLLEIILLHCSGIWHFIQRRAVLLKSVLVKTFCSVLQYFYFLYGFFSQFVFSDKWNTMGTSKQYSLVECKKSSATFIICAAQGRTTQPLAQTHKHSHVRSHCLRWGKVLCWQSCCISCSRAGSGISCTVLHCMMKIYLVSL